MTLNLKSLGFTQEELQEKVIERLCEQATSIIRYDEEGEEYTVKTNFSQKLNEVVQKHINDTIMAIAEKHVLPKVGEYIENLILQETNQWGEARGKPITFIEYLVQRAETYMTEKVNYEGKSKAQSAGFSWSGTQTRLSHLIHEHLHYSISTAMEKALKDANSHIVEGLEKTVKIKLEEISKGLKIGLKTGRR